MLCGVEYGRASYKGIEFEILPAEMSGGQRQITHLYSFWDEHYNEHLGRKPRRWRLRGLFTGPDFRDQMNAALEAWDNCEPGPFFEPTFGRTFQVQLDNDWQFEFDHRSINSAQFTLNLIEAALDPYPASGGRRIIRAAVDGAIEAATNDWLGNVTTFDEVISGLDASELPAGITSRIWDIFTEPGFAP